MTDAELDQAKRDGNYLRATVKRRVKLNGKDEGCCPFHPEKTASFGIFEGQNGHWRYKCLACGEKGTVVDYLMKDSGFGKAEAMRQIESDSGFADAKPKQKQAEKKLNGSDPSPPRKPKMTRLIAAAALIIAAATPALACDWNKSAGADSQSTVASQSGAQHSKPAQHSRS